VGRQPASATCTRVRLFERVCEGGRVTLGKPSARIRETATFVVAETGGERALYRLLLGELPAGRGYIYALELPWGGHEREQDFDTLAEACTAADDVYRLWPDAGVWRIERSGWQRPPMP
jgi:hypothetical protein